MTNDNHVLYDTFTGCFWSPKHPEGWQICEGQRISALSFGTFGSDMLQARKAHEKWVRDCQRLYANGIYVIK